MQRPRTSSVGSGQNQKLNSSRNPTPALDHYNINRTEARLKPPLASSLSPRSFQLNFLTTGIKFIDQESSFLG
jgi:hypothetical protein